jgi:hypothetical protein
MCHLDDDVDKAATPASTLDHTLERAARIGAHTKSQMGLMQAGAAVLIVVFLFAGSILAITTGGALADARTGYNAGLTGIVVACVMVVSWGALRGHRAILIVLGPLLTSFREIFAAVRELRAAVKEMRASVRDLRVEVKEMRVEVRELRARQERQIEAFNEIAVHASDRVARRRVGGG